MGRHSTKAADGEGFLRACWDAWYDLAISEKGTLSLIVAPSTRKGIFTFWLSFRKPSEVDRPYPDASVRAEYPNAQVQTLEAFLYSLVVKLERVIELQLRYPEGRG